MQDILTHVHLPTFLAINPEFEDLEDAIDRHATDCLVCREIQIKKADRYALCTRCIDQAVDSILF